MVNLTLVSSSAMTMTSREIAELVESRHDKVKQSIDRLVERGVISQPPMGDGVKSANGIVERVYIFDASHKRDTYVVVAQLSPEFTGRLVDRWQELEAEGSIPKITDPTLAALVQSVVELDHVKQQQAELANRQAALARQNEILENRIQNVELQHRNGVPEGYLSKKNAHHLYGEGLSEEIFHLALAKASVTIKNYIARDDNGNESATFAYLESEIEDAVDMLIENAEQCSPQMCKSPMLAGSGSGT